MEVTNPVLGVTALTGLKISVVLNDPANTTLQGTVALPQTVASVSGAFLLLLHGNHSNTVWCT